MKLARPALAAAALLTATACGGSAEAGSAVSADTPPAVQVRLPEPGNSGVLAVAKKDGSLDRALAAVHAKVAWTPAPAGFAEAAEALNSGRLDAAQGAVSTVLAPLAGTPGFSIFGVAQPDPIGEGILVKNNSGIKSVKELAGRKVAVDDGGTGEYLLLQALAKHKVPAEQVQRVHLGPEATRTAFATGEVDAWATTGEPVVTELAHASAYLVSSAFGAGSDNYRLWAVRTELAQQHPEVVRALYQYLHEAGDRARQDPAAYLNVFTDSGPDAVSGRAKEVLVDVGRAAAPVELVQEADTVRLEKVAQLFAAQKVTPSVVDVRSHLLDPSRLAGGPK
ncbi:NrtA/SsuA/CpmA family ABC transporter substrate-binding protein [Kitasatospora sp. NPDC057223]|uniref:NrtA/SsuA/CpmA family ABC transporter substrate-binding protein n=1 Tax=Kitasatospora sp. NPDC057223 TaxID=3346055 RepID=UPI0036327353